MADQQVTLDQYKHAYREIIMSEQKNGLYIHGIVYAIINALLIGINLYYTPFVLWFFFPLLGWGIGLAAHFVGVTRIAPQDLVKKEAEAEYRVRSQGALTK